MISSVSETMPFPIGLRKTSCISVKPVSIMSIFRNKILHLIGIKGIYRLTSMTVYSSDFSQDLVSIEINKGTVL